MNGGAASATGSSQAVLHATLRFAVGVTLAFVLCEAMQWAPTFLGPVLTAVLLANLPVRPPLKMAVALIVSMAVAALFSFALASLLRGVPVVLFGMVALCMFLCFHAISSGRTVLPFMLGLICLATIPVVVMVAPAQAGAFPMAMIRSIVVALVCIALVYLLWPLVPVTPAAAPRPPADKPVAQALLSLAVVMPLMLVYLLFGLADVLPVLVATVMLVINFDPQRSRMQALGMILGNFAGGLLGLLLHTLLMIAPNLVVLALLSLVVLLGFGQRIVAGGPMGAVALIACNAMLIIFSSALASDTGSLTLWLVRVFQFALAGAFAIGMMNLIWYRAGPMMAKP